MSEIWILVSIWFIQNKPEPLYIKQPSYETCMSAAKLEAAQGNGLAYCVPGYAKQIHEYEGSTAPDGKEK